MPKRSSIAASLGELQHLRKGKAVGDAGTRVSGSGDVRTRAAGGPAGGIRGGAKRSDPEFAQLKAYVPKDLKRRAMRRAEDEGYEDFSALVRELLEVYAGTR